MLQSLFPEVSSADRLKASAWALAFIGVGSYLMVCASRFALAAYTEAGKALGVAQPTTRTVRSIRS